jgi:hypothetical protein
MRNAMGCFPQRHQNPKMKLLCQAGLHPMAMSLPGWYNVGNQFIPGL